MLFIVIVNNMTAVLGIPFIYRCGKLYRSVNGTSVHSKHERVLETKFKLIIGNYS